MQLCCLCLDHEKVNRSMGGFVLRISKEVPWYR